MSRGSTRDTIFAFDGDRIAFLAKMGKVAARYGIRWISYCLMGNHYHAIAQTPDTRLSDAMCDLNGGFSRLTASVHGRDAHLFRNRFVAEHIDTNEYFATAMRYVHLNPVRAGLCRHPGDWAWSSYRTTVGLDKMPPFLAPEIFLRIGGMDAAAARADYVAFVEAGITTALSHTALGGAAGLTVPRRLDRVESAA